MKGKFKILIYLFLIFIVINIKAEEKQVGKKRTEVKEIQGSVTWVGKDKIAIIYASSETSEEEILLPFSPDLKFEHFKDLKQLKQGDTVAIQYEDIQEETEEGMKEKLVAKRIIFIRPAIPKPKVQN
ncbi:MAG: hypothetical protein NC935_07775 [Candidatus Omnitrophica bacterium]|nr:hypothetical protein [Candidatus Omnitrophota bacterium]